MDIFLVAIFAVVAGLIWGSIIGSRNVGYERGGVIGVGICLVVALASIVIGHYGFGIQENLIKSFFVGIYGVAIIGWLGWIAVVMLRKR